VKTNSLGVELWTKTYGSTGDEYAFTVIEHSIDFGFAMTGYTTSFGAGSLDFILVKTDSVGVEMWTKTYGGTSFDIARSMIEHSIDNGFVIAGRTASYGVGMNVCVNVNCNYLLSSIHYPLLTIYYPYTHRWQ
jgi:hypothetical protein